MNSPRSDTTNTQAMDKLRAIDQQRAAVENRLAERLQRQLGQLAALVSATKWRFMTLRYLHPATYTQQLVDTTTKKMRMEIGAFEYAAKEQSEQLTRALFQLDDILSNGDVEVKNARKALVLSIQQLLERADAMKLKAASLKQFSERVIDRLPVVPEQADEDMEATTEPQVETTAVANEHEDDDWEHVTAADVRPLFASDDEEEDTKPTEQESAVDDTVMVQPEETTAGDDDEDEDEDDDSEADDDMEQEDEPVSEEVEQQSSCDNEPALPVWRPYYQIQKRADGVYLIANLRGVDPRYLQVHAMPQQGMLRISGVKYPTQKDLLLSRLSGAPTFGRFEIVERFPAQMLNLENASQQLSEDGTLQVRLPFYFVHHPRVMRGFSPFQPRMMVW